MSSVSRDLGIRERFRAWWHGYDVSSEGRAAVDEAAHSAAPETPQAVQHSLPGRRRDWTRERVYVVQLVFGTGSHGPSIGSRTNDMIAPLALTPEMTALELGAGLGLGARTIGRQTGAWIDGIEPDRGLSVAAERLTGDVITDDRVTVSSVDLDDPSIQRHRRDAVVSREGLHRFPRPEETLMKARKLMKPTGQLVMTEFAVPDGVDKSQLEGLVEISPKPFHLWQLSELRSLMERVGFHVHAVRDESDDYVMDILRALQAFSTQLSDSPLPEHWREWVMVEVEYWARLVAMIEHGRLRLQRFSASLHAPILGHTNGH